jgi:hypothetical protein
LHHVLTGTSGSGDLAAKSKVRDVAKFASPFALSMMAIVAANEEIDGHCMQLCIGVEMF